MTNVIPIKLRCEPLGPFQTIKELHSLYEKLRHLKAETMLLDEKLSPDIQSAPARNAINQASTLVSSAADEILEAIAGLIVETTANLIVPPAQHQDQPS